MRTRVIAGAVVALVAALAVVAAGYGRSGGRDVLPTSSCSPLAYNGSGKPQFIIASDLPLQSAVRQQTVQMNKAISYVLAQHHFKAGKYTVGFQSCDDSTAQAGKWVSAKCSANAQNYARDSQVIGVIGTFNSGCAEIEIPVLNRAPNGPLGMISPANTYVGLTHGGPGTAAGEPGKYYPSGKRNYIRVVAADDFQGAADALLAKSLSVKKVYVLNDKEAYGLGLASNFRNAAKKLGLQIAGFEAIDPNASSYEALGTKIQQSGAQGVFIGSLICENGGKLVKDLRSTGGPSLKIMAPDGFTPITEVVKEAGTAAEGMTISVAGEPDTALKGAGAAFVKAFSKQAGGPIAPYTAYAAAAAEVFVQAVAKSNGTRASVTANLFKTKVTNGILGSFSINPNGDTSSNPVTIYQVKGGKQTTYKVITPPTSLVRAA